MLTELTIRNLAIIDKLRLQFAPGFNVLTGETGAGKSIILDAMSLVLGGRADTTLVRAQAAGAYVEAVFTLPPHVQQQLLPLLEAEGLEGEATDLLVLARELRANGRSFSRVNGRAVNLAVLRQITAPLLDIHGQGEHLSLLRRRAHLPLLDAYAGLEKERGEVAAAVGRLQKIRQALSELRQNRRDNAQRAEMLQYQIQEIGAANLQPGEEAELRAERTRLGNTEQLMLAATQAVTLITGMDDDTPAAADMLGQAERALVQLTRYDETQGPLLENLQGIIYQLSELSSDLQSYLDKLEFNPGRLDFVEERLALIQSLKRKYGETVADVLARQEAAAAELAQIEGSEERLATLEREEETALRQVGELALALSQKRQAAAEKLATAVETQLAELNMPGARFRVDFQQEAQADGVYAGGERLAYDQTGIDRVAFLISTNPGEPLKPVARVASGGETARLMLALKTALAQADTTPTLIFDEIDQGIGGRIGDVVGRKLWGLTAVGQHQVIVVTHLPQLAGYGDAHFRVSKGVVDGRTVTRVEDLDRDGRVQELAAMLGAQGKHATAAAESILEQANKVKAKNKNHIANVK